MLGNMLLYFGEYVIRATLIRATGGSYAADGTWVVGPETSESIPILAPQPAPGETQLLIPEGESLSDYVMTMAASSVGIRAREGSDEPDEILIGDTRYRVFLIERWGAYGGFDKLIMRRMDT